MTDTIQTLLTAVPYVVVALCSAAGALILVDTAKSARSASFLRKR